MEERIMNFPVLFLFSVMLVTAVFGGCSLEEEKGKIDDCQARSRLIVAGGSVNAAPYDSGDQFYLEGGSCVESCEGAYHECYYTAPDGCRLLMACKDGEEVDAGISGQWDMLSRKCY
jgi:hypothetical protein